MKRMLQLCVDEKARYNFDPEDWKATVVPFSKINEIMDELANGHNTSNFCYIFEW